MLDQLIEEVGIMTENTAQDEAQTKRWKDEAGAMSLAELDREAKRLKAVTDEVAWRKRNVARINAGIVERAESKDEATKKWVEELRREAIAELRKTEADEATKKGKKTADSAPGSTPTKPSGDVLQKAPQGAVQGVARVPQNTVPQPVAGPANGGPNAPAQGLSRS